MTVGNLTAARNRVETLRDLLALLENSRITQPRAAHDPMCRAENALARTDHPCTCGADELNNRLRVAIEQLRKAV